MRTTYLPCAHGRYKFNRVYIFLCWSYQITVLKGQFFCTNSVFGFLAVYSNLEVCFSYGHTHCFIIESNIVLVLFWICGVTSVKELHPGTQIKIRPKSYLHPVLYLAMCKYFESHGKWTDWKNMDIPNVDIIAVNFFIALVFGVLYTV